MQGAFWRLQSVEKILTISPADAASLSNSQRAHLPKELLQGRLRLKASHHLCVQDWQGGSVFSAHSLWEQVQESCDSYELRADFHERHPLEADIDYLVNFTVGHLLSHF